MNKKHFIFDFDDTLTNSYEFNQQMFVDTFVPYVDINEPKTDKYLRDLHYKSRGMAMHFQFDQAIKQLGLKTKSSILVKENEDLHLENVHKITIFDSISDLFKKIKNDGRTISICTNRNHGSLNKIIKLNKLEPYFDNIVSCIDEGHEKPDPYCLLNLIKNSGISKKNSIYFGDSKTDFEFASNAGIDFLIIDHYLNQKKFYTMILKTFMLG